MSEPILNTKGGAMKKIVVAGLLCLIFVPAVFARGKTDTDLKFEKVGVGIVVGDPLGITVKLWNSKETAFDGVLSIGNPRTFYLHADYLSHNYELLKDLAKDLKGGELIFYYGAGAYIATWSTSPFGLGARLPVGAEYISHPFDIYLELAPAFAITPAMGLGLYWGLGVRFDF